MLRKRLKQLLIALAAAVLVCLGLFVLNGTTLSDGEQPIVGTVESGVDEPPAGSAGHVRVMAFNVAKCFVMNGPASFESEAVIDERLDALASIIRIENPDILCLSEIMTEAGPCDVNQVTTLARKTGLSHWAFGENYCFGLPFLRVVGGNAILSRYPIEPIANPSLAGRQPFYVTKNNRRALLARVMLPGGEVPVWSLHNDSYDINNNLSQIEQLLRHPQTPGSIMAGDFNAGPDSKPLQRLLDTGDFTGQLDGEATFPANQPDQRIDFVFGPSGWSVVEYRVVQNEISDHCAVVTVFRRN